MSEEYIKIALNEAKKAFLEGEIPVGAVIAHNNKIIAKTHNKKEKLKCSIKHAEILAIEQSSKKLDSWRLNECEMYVTMEPCIMCCGAILQSRIKKIYYLIDNSKFGGLDNVNVILKNKKHNIEVYKINNEKLENEMQTMLREFFESKR